MQVTKRKQTNSNLNFMMLNDEDESRKHFENWFLNEDYGSFGGTRSLYFFDDVKSGANATVLRKWLEAAFSVGYQSGKLDSQNQ